MTPRGVRPNGLRSVGGVARATLLTLAGLAIAGLCFREAAVRALPPSTPLVAAIAADHPSVVLAQSKIDLVQKNGILDAATLDATRRSAERAPLDARPFLILGHQQLLDRQPDRAVRTLERSQLLDPRERITHLLLVDRYLRTERYADAAAQFSVLARMMGEAQEPVAVAVAEMTRIAETRDAVRKTLRTDPTLERAVLRALANSKTAPNEIFALASPIALREAGAPDNWGPVLITRLVKQGRFGEARRVWQRVYRLSSAQVAPPLFNPEFRGTAASPPFDWTFAAGSLGAADPRDGSLAIDYYGRENGMLAGQLLTLRPGSYRISFIVEGAKTAGAPSLFWSLGCMTGNEAKPGPEILRMPLISTGQTRRVAAAFTVPANCPAQQLSLTGQANEFPVPVNVTLRDLSLNPGPGTKQP